jgi:hypothetical protein
MEFWSNGKLQAEATRLQPFIAVLSGNADRRLHGRDQLIRQISGLAGDWFDTRESGTPDLRSITRAHCGSYQAGRWIVFLDGHLPGAVINWAYDKSGRAIVVGWLISADFERFVLIRLFQPR